MVESTFFNDKFHQVLDDAVYKMTSLRNAVVDEFRMEWVLSRDMFRWLDGQNKFGHTYSSEGWCETYLYDWPVYVSHRYSDMVGVQMFPVIYMGNYAVFTDKLVDSLPVGTKIRHCDNILEVSEIGHGLRHVLNLTGIQVVSPLEGIWDADRPPRRRTLAERIWAHYGTQEEPTPSLDGIEPVDISFLFGDAE